MSCIPRRLCGEVQTGRMCCTRPSTTRPWVRSPSPGSPLPPPPGPTPPRRASDTRRYVVFICWRIDDHLYHFKYFGSVMAKRGKCISSLNISHNEKHIFFEMLKAYNRVFYIDEVAKVCLFRTENDKLFI